MNATKLNKPFTIGVILLGFMSKGALGANETEYATFIESNGAIVLETYRMPKGSDLSYWGTDPDAYFYKTLDSDMDRKAPYWTKGYFNSDDKPDYLYILFHRKHNMAWLIGFISTESGYRAISIEPSDKNMAVETKNKIVKHFRLEGHGHALSWDESEARFNIFQ